MESMCLFLIVISILIVRAGTMKNKMPQNKNRDVNSNPQYEELNRERHSNRQHRQMRKAAKYSNPQETMQPSDIELRRMQQHENYNRSRIHRNVHKEVNKPEPKQLTVNAENIKTDTKVSDHIDNISKKETVNSNIGQPAINMNDLRDIIVCGYPVEIPNQRDFVKEGEEFLANLGVSSMFI